MYNKFPNIENSLSQFIRVLNLSHMGPHTLNVHVHLSCGTRAQTVPSFKIRISSAYRKFYIKVSSSETIYLSTAQLGS